MSHQRQSSLGFQFFLVGTLAWLGAALFGLYEPRVLVKQDVGREPAQYAPNLTAAGASVESAAGCAFSEPLSCMPRQGNSRAPATRRTRRCCRLAPPPLLGLQRP